MRIYLLFEEFCLYAYYKLIPIYARKIFESILLFPWTVQITNSASFYQLPIIHVVPPIAVLLAKSPLTEKYDLTCIEGVMCAAAPLSATVEKELCAKIKGKDVKILQSMYQWYYLKLLRLWLMLWMCSSILGFHCCLKEWMKEVQIV